MTKHIFSVTCLSSKNIKLFIILSICSLIFTILCVLLLTTVNKKHYNFLADPLKHHRTRWALGMTILSLTFLNDGYVLLETINYKLKYFVDEHVSNKLKFNIFLTR